MATAHFIDDLSLEVIAPDGEVFTLKAFLPISKDEQPELVKEVAYYFDKHFSLGSDEYVGPFRIL